MLFLTVWLTIIVQIGKTCIGFYYDQLYIADSGKDWSDLSAYFILIGENSLKNLNLSEFNERRRVDPLDYSYDWEISCSYMFNYSLLVVCTAFFSIYFLEELKFVGY